MNRSIMLFYVVFFSFINNTKANDGQAHFKVFFFCSRKPIK